ncbi:MAG: xanthine dehydrogenase accessory protein XdhC [Opitutaceae bacterium]|nr:xanthine dehydrogenase accessory protein XdhC [Opitutaceae bacterium]
MTEPAPTLYEQVVALEREGTGFVLVILIETLGSTPQDAGAKMLVTAAGRQSGTVGGGKIEAEAIALAQEMLGQITPQPRFVSWTLKGDVGMTCGGSVKFYLEPHVAEGAGWPLAIFGAGHVSQALLRVLVPLPCSITVCDSRAEWLEQLPRARNVRVVTQDQPARLVAELPEHAFVLCMTKGHTTDLPILQQALGRKFPFVGAIGSEAKAAVLRRELVAGGLAPDRAAQLHCPLGLPFGQNHPHEIALSIAAQLLSERDRVGGEMPAAAPAAPPPPAPAEKPESAPG